MVANNRDIEADHPGKGDARAIQADDAKDLCGSERGWRRWVDEICTAGALAFVVLLAGIFPMGVLLGFLIISGLLIMRRRWRVLVMFLLLAPPMGSFLLSTGLYAMGRGTLIYEGLPMTEFHNLDPELRCERFTSGCLVSGDEWMTHMPNNAAMWVMTKAFGYQRGTYTGPYPTEEEAKEAVKKADVVDPRRLMNDVVMLNGLELKLAPGVGRKLVRGFTWVDCVLEKGEEFWKQYFGPVPVIRGAVWKDRCLILRVPRDSFEGKDDSAMIAVFDLERGRPFAYYAEGEYRHNFPPVRWRE